MGMPADLIRLICEWLVGRSFYIQVGDDCSSLFDSDCGTIQGSVLGPVLYALFVSPFLISPSSQILLMTIIALSGTQTLLFW